MQYEICLPHKWSLCYLVVQSPRVEGLFRQLHRWFHLLGEGFSLSLFIFGPQYFLYTRKAVYQLINHFSGTAKFARRTGGGSRVRGRSVDDKWTKVSPSKLSLIIN